MTTLHKMTVVRLLAVFSLALVFLAGCAQVPVLDDGVMKATQLYQQGDHDGVIALLQPMADRDPSLSTTSLELLGMAYFNKHQYPQAVAIMERATAPGMFSGMPFGGRRINMRNHGVLGWCYFHMKDLDRSMAAFNKALAKSDFRREPAWDESALRGRGWARYFQGDFEGAAEDISAVQKIIQANPGMMSASVILDVNLVLAYINLALNRDDIALKMAAAAEASAKAAGQDINKSLAAIYLMLGQRDKAYGLWGSAASLGVALQDYRSGNTQGVRIVEVLEGGSGQQAGLKPGDIIVALDDKPVSAAQAFTRQIGTRHPRQSVQMALLRNGSQVNVSITLAGPDALIAKHNLLQPALKVRQIPASAMANAVPPVMASGSIVPVAFPPVQTSASIPQVETPVPSELRIESMRVAPSSVPAGERFEVTVDLFALDQDVREETVAVVLRYTISQQGKALARLAPETLKVPNGVPSSLSNKIRAGKTKGKYSVQVEVEMGAQKTRSETAFSIR